MNERILDSMEPLPQILGELFLLFPLWALLFRDDSFAEQSPHSHSFLSESP